MIHDKRTTVRLPANLKAAAQRLSNTAVYMNESDLIREALREKIKHDAPELYAELLGYNTNQGGPSR